MPPAPEQPPPLQSEQPTDSAGAAAPQSAAMAADPAPTARAPTVQAPANGVAPPDNLAPARPWFKEPCIMGIDEAGRGPVLGPMVYAAAVAPASYKDELAAKPYADSKTLTEAQRSALFAQLLADEKLGYAYDALPASAISATMLARARLSLNEAAFAATARVIQRALDAGVAVTDVYVDTVGDPERHRAKLSRAFPGVEFTVCPKADALYPIVSAASVVAKVTRDAALAAEQAALPPRFAPSTPAGLGTGYPHDEATKQWLAASVDAVFGFPPLVRFSWETAARILEDKAVPMAFEADAPPGSASQPKLSAFVSRGGGSGGSGGSAGGGKAPEPSSGVGRHAFFRVRRMQRAAALLP